MQNFWDRLKVGIREGASVSAERVETYSKIGRLKIEQLNHKNSIKKNEQKLGILLYHVVKNGALSTIDQNSEVHELVGAIDTAHEAINGIAEKISQIKAEKSEKSSVESLDTTVSEDAQEDID